MCSLCVSSTHYIKVLINHPWILVSPAGTKGHCILLQSLSVPSTWRQGSCTTSQVGLELIRYAVEGWITGVCHQAQPLAFNKGETKKGNSTLHLSLI